MIDEKDIIKRLIVMKENEKHIRKIYHDLKTKSPQRTKDANLMIKLSYIRERTFEIKYLNVLTRMRSLSCKIRLDALRH